VRDLTAARAAATLPKVVFVYQGMPEQGAAWFPPGTAAIADLDKVLYDAFEVERGGMREMFGTVGVWTCGVRAALKGNMIGRPIGDPWTLPLIVALRDGDVVWEHRGTHAGDMPSPSQLAELARG
jgi:hypothetical protein